MKGDNMGALIVGSTAMDILFADTPREPKDQDYITTTDSAGFWREMTGGDVFSDARLDTYINTTVNPGYIRVVSIDELYTIKVSHSYWELKNGSWNKHIYDVRFLKRKGASLDLLLHDQLYEVWSDLHGAKRSNLAMEKDSFFQDAVTRVYDHDSIHDSVSYGEEALYNQVLKAGSTVDIDSKKLWSLGYDQLVLLFREEVCATALERLVIPRNYRVSPGAAYRWALRRTITSLTKGKSARFIVENFESFAKPCNYVARHEARKDRLIKL